MMYVYTNILCRKSAESWRSISAVSPESLNNISTSDFESKKRGHNSIEFLTAHDMKVTTAEGLLLTKKPKKKELKQPTVTITKVNPTKNKNETNIIQTPNRPMGYYICEYCLRTFEDTSTIRIHKLKCKSETSHGVKKVNNSTDRDPLNISTVKTEPDTENVTCEPAINLDYYQDN